MDILNPKTLRERAGCALARGREPKKLVLAYAGISLAMSLLMLLANLWLENQISGTSGLSNLGSRAIFSTAQQAIPIVVTFVSMCLELGYLSGMMRICRGQYADHTDLKAGFRKFFPLMRLALIQGMIYLAVGILAVQLGSVIFAMTPWSRPLQDAILELSMTDPAALDEAMILGLMEHMGPMYVIVGVVYLAILIPFLHRFRMANFCLLDDPKGSALAAIRASTRMMRRRFGAMLKIDLSLWMYYAAMAVVTVILYLDLILPALGITPPVDAMLFSLLVTAAALALQFGVQLRLRNRVEATYLTAYEQLREKPRDEGVVLGNIFDM